MIVLRSSRLPYLVALCFAVLYFRTLLQSHSAFGVLGQRSLPQPEGFPRKIWQTWKTGLADMSEDNRKPIFNWQWINPTWRFELLTDETAKTFVQDRFPGTRATEIFTSLGDPILRADFIRYLVLLADGGVYADIDTITLKPMEDWIPPEFHNRTNVVIGVEYDRRDQERWEDWPTDLQFANWVIMSKPQHPVFNLTVQKVVRNLQALADKHGDTMADVSYRYQHEVLLTTGPTVMTEAVFEYLRTATETDFTWQNVTRLESPKLVHDVLILPVNAFGSGQHHSGSGEPYNEGTYVQHLFRGSWKDARPVEGVKKGA